VTTLSDIGEDALIQRLVGLLPVDPEPAAGPGDDCAVVDLGPAFERLQLLKTDALVENVHFLPSAPPRAVGWKAIARVVSDFAAMGGKPERFLITLALPPQTEVEWAEDLYRGMGDCLRRYGAVLAGGETSSVPAGSAAVIVVAATGSVARSEVTLRSTAQPGDAILVTGSLGGSGSGKHLTFEPRLEQTTWLVSNFKPSAMMDLSDGLARDLPRMARASGVGYAMDCGSLPVTAGCSVAQALGDGEDFEMLFTLADERVAGLLEAWAEVFPELPLTRIGTMVAAGRGEELEGGWDHFPPSSTPV
jgi:thiamine-monophosphate kinase